MFLVFSFCLLFVFCVIFCFFVFFLFFGFFASLLFLFDESFLFLCLALHDWLLLPFKICDTRFHSSNCHLYVLHESRLCLIPRSERLVFCLRRVQLNVFRGEKQSESLPFFKPWIILVYVMPYLTALLHCQS